MRKPGRPPASNPKDCRVTVRFSAAELAKLKASAEEAGFRSVSTYVRETALKHRVQGVVPALNREAYQGLAKTMNNLNQLAKHWNTMRVKGLDLDLDRGQVDLEERMDELVKALKSTRKELLGL